MRQPALHFVVLAHKHYLRLIALALGQYLLVEGEVLAVGIISELGDQIYILIISLPLHAVGDCVVAADFAVVVASHKIVSAEASKVCGARRSPVGLRTLYSQDEGLREVVNHLCG